MKVGKSSGSHAEQSNVISEIQRDALSASHIINMHQFEEPEIKPAAKLTESGLQFCRICMEEKIKQKMFKSTICPHSFCKQCMSSHVSAKICDGITHVNCPEPSCKVKVQPRNCLSFMPRNVVERWEMMIIESEMGSNRIYCPYRDCSAVVGGVEDQDRDVTSAKCPKCNRLFSQCTQDKWEKIMDKKFMKIAHSENWKKCPRCKFYVQKSSGCSGIRCRCGCYFCYDCGESYYSAHACRRTRHLYLARSLECLIISAALLFCIYLGYQSYQLI